MGLLTRYIPTTTIASSPSPPPHSANLAESTRKRKKKMISLQSWVAEHKLTSIGAVWASALGTSMAVARWRTPMVKTSLRLIHARMHAQALALAVLSGAALLHHYDVAGEDRRAAAAMDDGENVNNTPSPFA